MASNLARDGGFEEWRQERWMGRRRGLPGGGGGQRRGRCRRASGIGSLKSTTTKRRGSVLQTKRRHDGGKGRDPQTNSVGLLKSTENGPKTNSVGLLETTTNNRSSEN